MKQIILALLVAVTFAQQACYKDKGNYDYQNLAIPEIKNLDTLYTVLVGDTLHVNPVITSPNPNAKLGFQWSISFPLELRDTTFNSSSMNFLFKFKPDRYIARLTITDSSNGMKYFHTTNISGVTPYSKGMLVLSAEGSTSQLTFMRPDGSVEPHVYRTWNGGDLPGKPLQLINLFKQNINPPPALGYWITFDESNDGGVHIATNSLVKIKSLLGNYFAPPDSAKPGYLETSQDGVLRGVVNGKLQVGSSYTYHGVDIYGMFSLPTPGDYTLYKRVAFNAAPYFIGYDIKRKQFVAFTNFGSASYIGTGYQTTTTTAFDPKNVGLDLLHFQQINNQNCFAFGKAADGTVYELKFGAAFMGFVQLSPTYKRPFPQQALITPTTKWEAYVDEVFYFTSGDKVYRYNPTNQDLQPLVADFGGKAVTMIKQVDQNTLVAGVDGAVFLLDVSVGKSGNILKTYTGIPGEPVDVAIRN